MAARAESDVKIPGGGRGGGHGQAPSFLGEQGVGRFLHDNAQRSAILVQPIHLVNDRLGGGGKVLHVHLEFQVALGCGHIPHFNDLQNAAQRGIHRHPFVRQLFARRLRGGLGRFGGAGSGRRATGQDEQRQEQKWGFHLPGNLPEPRRQFHRKEQLQISLRCETKLFVHVVGTPRRGVRASRRDAPCQEKNSVSQPLGSDLQAVEARAVGGVAVGDVE